MHLMRILAQLSVTLRHKDEVNKKISEVSVAWHIDHSLRVINAVFDSLQKSDPKKYVDEANPVRAYVLENKIIKRGVAESPKHVLPETIIEPKTLLESLESAKKAITLIDTLPKNCYFDHHKMGMLKRDEAKKFLKIHTRHHLGIIDDILAQNKISNKTHNKVLVAESQLPS